MSKKILFFGNEKIATGISTKTPIFRGLIEASFDIRALIIAQSLDSKSDQLEIVRCAKEHAIEVKSYQNLKESATEIGNLGAETAVLVSYGRIVPKELLEAFKVGIVNVHPSLLPRHRGPTPIESTILEGDSKTGVSIMRLAEAMDAGPIYSQKSLKLSGNESKQNLADILSETGKDLILDCLGDIIDGSLKPTEQSGSSATYDKLIAKDDGLINWQSPWIKIERMIRAYSGWPKVRFSIGDLNIALTKAHFINESGIAGQFIKYNEQLACYCHDGLVVIDELLPASSKVMSSQSFLLGHRELLS